MIGRVYESASRRQQEGQGKRRKPPSRAVFWRLSASLSESSREDVELLALSEVDGAVWEHPALLWAGARMGC